MLRDVARSVVWVFLSLALLALPTTASSAVPTSVHFQGLLLDGVGAPVNGAVDLDFALYPTLVGGAALWSESHLTVPRTGSTRLRWARGRR